MSSSEPQSKRERQKQRREAKLAQQRAADAKSRRNRLIGFALLGVVFAGLVGGAVWQNRQQAAEQQAERDALAARLDELGCTPDEQREDEGQAHLETAQLAQNPPDALYADRPATSGTHFSNWVITGVYDQVIDERLLVHDLEHGYIVGYYDEDAPEDQVSAFKAYAQEQIDGSYPKIIVAPFDGTLSGDANFAYTAWNQRQMCAEYDETAFRLFIDEHHSGAGEAPEKTLPAHTTPDSGIDPGTEPVLLPPLGEDAPTEGMEEGAGEDGATEGATEAAS